MCGNGWGRIRVVTLRAVGQCWKAVKALGKDSGGGAGTKRAQRSKHLELDPWFGHRPEGVGLPVCLFHLFPHDHVETRAILVAEDEASVVIISDRVHMECALEVYAIEGCVPCRRGERNGASQNLLALDTQFLQKTRFTSNLVF